jgi:hypothetical protein
MGWRVAAAGTCRRFAGSGIPVSVLAAVSLSTVDSGGISGALRRTGIGMPVMSKADFDDAGSGD